MGALNSYIVWKDPLYEITVFILPMFTLAMILNLTWSGSNLLSQCVLFFVLIESQWKNLFVFIYLWISRNLWREALLVVVISNLLVFSYFWYRSILYPASCVILKLEQRERNARALGQLSEFKVFVLMFFSVTLSDSIEDSPNHDFVFSFSVASPKMLFGIVFSNVTRMQTLPT